MATPAQIAFSLIMGALMVTLAARNVWAQETPPPPVVRILVEDHSQVVGPTEKLPPLFIASSANNWDPGTYPAGGTFTDPDGTRGWIVEYDAATAFSSTFEFKFTRGGWDTVEVDDQGRDVANRRIGTADVATKAREVRVKLMGFVDQRGSRFPASPAPAPRPATITGDVAVFTVHSDVLGADRTVRVWTPPGYEASAAKGEKFPVMYFCDGQNMFSRADNDFGVEWQADETADRLIRANTIPALIMVAVDHSGATRGVDYNPPGTSFRGQDFRGDLYLRFLVDELMPEIAKRYAVRTEPEYTGLGGSSFGGNFTLYAITERPGVFSRALIESPALWLSDGALITRAEKCSAWPTRVFVAMGDSEYGESDRDRGLKEFADRLDAAIRKAGLGSDRYRFVIEKGGRHHEDTWAGRLPGALEFLWGPRL